MEQSQRNKIKVTHRSGKAGVIRRQGWVPGIVYGHGLKNVQVQVESKTLGKVLVEAGRSSLIDLSIEGGEKGGDHLVLMRDVQYHPVRGQITHVDFYQPRLDEAITVAVPIRFIGEAPGVKDLGGILFKALDELEVEALPVDLPRDIEVDVASLATINAVVKVRDLILPPKVKVMQEPEEVVVLVQPPRSEEEISQLSEEVKEDVTAVEGVKDEVKEGEEKEEAASQQPKEPTVQKSENRKQK